MRIYRYTVGVSLLILFVIFASGCSSKQTPIEISQTGFLKDYSKLEYTSSTSYRYINPQYKLSGYSKFIVDPVVLHFDSETRTEVGSWEELQQLKSYMQKTVINTLEPRYSAVGTIPGPKTARIRIALTHLKKGSIGNLGSVSMEAELLDSQTNEQIAAIIELHGKRNRYGGLSKWDDAKAAMDDWAKRLYNRLEEARGY